jgi:hypothetical protein
LPVAVLGSTQNSKRTGHLNPASSDGKERAIPPPSPPDSRGARRR